MFNSVIFLLVGFLAGFVFSGIYFFRKKQYLENKILQIQTEIQKENFKNEFLTQEIESRKSLAQDLSRELEELFKIKSAEVLEDKTKKLLELADSNFKRETASQNEVLQKRDESLKQDFKFLFDQIQKYQGALGQFEKEREKTLGSVENQLKNVIEINSVLGQQTQSLKEALSKPNIRGRWGEIQLKTCVELAGMSEFCDVEFQAEFRDEKTIRPDMLVKLPSGKTIIVDAKTPMDFYLKYIDEKNENLRTQYLDQHSKSLRNHIKELSSKAYYKTVGLQSLDYVVLFLPNESFLFAAIESDKNIIDYALSNKVMITTPPTFVALLRAIHMGWGEYKVTENAKTIYEQSKELSKRLHTFSENFLNLESQLEKSLETFRSAKNAFQTRVLKQAQRIDSLEGLSTSPLEGSGEVNI